MNFFVKVKKLLTVFANNFIYFIKIIILFYLYFIRLTLFYTSGASFVYEIMVSNRWFYFKQLISIKKSVKLKIEKWVLLNRAPTSTQLHPPPPSSIHLHLAHFNLHPAPSTSTQLISASTQPSATLSTIFEPKYCTQLGNFPKFRPKN